MRVIDSIDNSMVFNNPILTIGTYDGVHLGHQGILSALIDRAQEKGRESVLLTFNPHPRKIISPESANLMLIDSQEEKRNKLENLGLQTLIEYPFSLEFAQLTADEFVKKILVDLIGVSEVWVGHDHQFGKNRSGNFEELVKLGIKYGFDVNQIDAIQSKDIVVSSTKIRNAILDGELGKANEMLGSVFSFKGNVMHGNKLGRTIGFPTANLHPVDTDKIIPKIGVYAVTAKLRDTVFGGVMNIGVKPTVNELENRSIEVHLFDFNQDIYDEELEVFCHFRLRDEQKFDSIEELIQQIKKDVEIAHTMLTTVL